MRANPDPVSLVLQALRGSGWGDMAVRGSGGRRAARTAMMGPATRAQLDTTALYQMPHLARTVPLENTRPRLAQRHASI